MGMKYCFFFFSSFVIVEEVLLTAIELFLTFSAGENARPKQTPLMQET